MNGLTFETRLDDEIYTPVAHELDDVDREFAYMVAQETWQNPREFGHIESAFELHVAVARDRAISLGLAKEYSEDLLVAQDRLADLQGQMMSYDAFY